MGYGKADVAVQKFSTDTKVLIGSELLFSFDVISNKKQKVLIDYNLYFQKANGELAPKTFKLVSKVLDEGEVLHVEKTHAFKLMSTRTLYPGEHVLEIQINGEKVAKKSFTVY
jgi:hypothetical protein